MKLIAPAIEFDKQIRAYRDAFLACGDSMDGTGGLAQFAHTQEWIAHANRCKNPDTVPQGLVPATQYMLLREEDQKIVGMIQIRHVFNDYLETYGGHIGYSVAPDERRKGYATQMLKMALPECKALGLDQVLLTCISGNEGSKRVILHNGGRYESAVYEPQKGVFLERYWIDLSAY